MEKLSDFLTGIVNPLTRKSTLLNKASWLLETTGSKDAGDLKAALDTELRLLLSDTHTFERLDAWDRNSAVADPLQKRELNVLIRAFKSNLLPKGLLEEIAHKESFLLQHYANFRPELQGKKVSENALRAILKKENDPHIRKMAWETSKQIGELLAPLILELIALRNEAAKALGYTDYFTMQLVLQEVDKEWLFSTLEELAKASDAAYSKVVQEIEASQCTRFGVQKEDLGPWAWSEPFGQEDPVDSAALDSLVEGIDMLAVCKSFYEQMGIDVSGILERSDMYERPGKNQHAFCTHIDREGDVRTLNNLQPTIKWLETLLHELGHAVYEMGFDPRLPWLLREPPHMLTTEAMALIAGRQAYRYNALQFLVGNREEALMHKGEESLKRRQLIFSRWVLVMTHFEIALYENPQQNLNALWWSLVEKYQKIRRPLGRERKCDWASKYHIGLAPVYYYSYLLGEMLASALEEAIERETGSRELTHKKAGQFLQEKLFHPGNSLRWDILIERAIGKPLSADAWIKQFA